MHVEAPTIAGHKIRPLCLGSLSLFERLNLTLFTDADAAEKIDQNETMRQLVAFFWMQSQPIDEVMTAVREGRANEAIEAFSFEIDVHELPALMKHASELSKLAVEVGDIAEAL